MRRQTGCFHGDTQNRERDCRDDWLSADVRNIYICIFVFYKSRKWEDMKRDEEERDESHPQKLKITL